MGAALLGLHFTAALFSQMPLSPLKLRYYPHVARYLEPYFAQNWMLFAPDPLSDDRGILVRARCADQTVTAFYDVTSPLIDRVQHNRFFPSRMSRLVTSNAVQLAAPDPVLARLREAEKTEDRPQLPLLPQEKTTQEEARRALERYGLSQLPAGACAGRPDSVQLRMYVHQPPPWSQRKDPSARGVTDAHDYDWTKAEDLR